MQKTLRLLFISFLIIVRAAGHSGAAPAYFIENKGQWGKDVLFRAAIPRGFLFLKENSLLYVLYDGAKVSALHAQGYGHLPATRLDMSAPGIRAHGVEVKFLNVSVNVSYRKVKESKTLFNYFLGNDSGKWAAGARGYEEVVYEDIYPDIDLRIYLNQAKLKYEFIVGPGADASKISFQYKGADKVALNEAGQIVVKTSVGDFREAQPYSFQQQADARITEVPSAFRLSGDNTAHFELPGGYNKSLPLTIDPELVFSTYSGSAADNWGHTATYDDEGNLYSGGTVFGTDFPATTGAFQVKFEGLVDVSLMKFNPDGSDLLYATFLGGDQTDVPASLIVNNRKELLVLGTTSSKDFPVGANAFQRVFGGGVNIEPISGLRLANGGDLFVSKLNAAGNQLTGSTFVGGNGNDGVSITDNVTIRNYGDSFRGEIGVDGNDQVYVVSSTNSANFPLKNPAQARLAGGQDGVVVKLSAGLDQLLWATYLGGDKWDAAYSLKLAVDGEVYVAGISQSGNMQVKPGAYQSALKGLEDGFVARFANDRLSALTYLGTDKEDGAYLLDLDQAGQVYVYGLTMGSYPVSKGVYQNAKSGQFVHALNAALTQSLFSTVIGSGRGTPDISPTAFLVSECGNIYLAGWGGNVNSGTANNPASTTTGLPVTDDAIQTATNGSNFYIAILEQGAKSLLYATFFGSLSRDTRLQGDHVDGGTSRFDKNGMIYHATCACGGSHFPTTPQAWSETNNSDNCNNAAFKIDIDRLKADFDVYAGQTKDVLKGCAPLELTFVNTSDGGVDYIWEVNGATISRDKGQSEYTFTKPGEYTVKLTAYNRLSCKRMDFAEKKIVVETLATKVTGDTTVCENTAVKLSASGGTQYKWSPAAGLDNAGIPGPVATVKETVEYSVEISNAAGCKVTERVKINVEKKTDFVGLPDTEVCQGATVTLTVSGNAPQYKWHATTGLEETIGKTVTVKPTQTTTYLIEGLYEDGCRPIREITVKVDQSYAPDFEMVRSGGACNEPFFYSFTSKNGKAHSYEWNMGTGSPVTDPEVKNYIYEVPGEYTVTLTAYNATGCSLTTSRKINAEPAFTLSNVITPNGDGKNDFFIVPVASSTLEIFNRWGKSIFKSADYKNDWGKGIANGTYLYVVDTPQGNHCKGWVEVLE
ncbi:gliding motility-associated C-terminal domain-containing protein [Dyadobacter sp. 676]|uniref:Gliding motility-associated C-terminal domain-containing protein n=1 Tax=Dyadobacter sp. 676 TaxID=3088362 RepID=A0AAU8FDP0_9BACT